MRIIRIIASFYKSYLIVSSIITISCMNFTYMYGLSIITVLFWFKLITLGIIIYYINTYKNNEFYYYQNLGLSKQFLWVSSIIFDISLFAFLLTIMLQIR